MRDVYNELKSRGLKSKLVLQIHDELIIETAKDEQEIKIISGKQKTKQEKKTEG